MKARELHSEDGTGAWYFTRLKDGEVEPVGHCAGWCYGHSSASEAEEHWQDYLDLIGDCQLCREEPHWIVLLLEYSGSRRRPFSLCCEHATREIVRKIVRGDGEIEIVPLEDDNE